MPLLLALDVSSLTMSLVNIASSGGDETALADSVEAALRAVTHLDVDRVGDTVVAQADVGHSERVVVAGHLGAQRSENAMAYVEMGMLFGPGASDAKGALAVALKAAAAGGYSRDVTFIFYAEGEGPGIADDAVLSAGFALLAEPTDCAVTGSGSALDHPWARQLLELTGVDPGPDPRRAHGLERFVSLGVPVVAFGPGDPSNAGTAGECVPTAQLAQSEFVLRQWLTT